MRHGYKMIQPPSPLGAIDDAMVAAECDHTEKFRPIEKMTSKKQYHLNKARFIVSQRIINRPWITKSVSYMVCGDYFL